MIKSQGFSLVEILISLFLINIMMLGLIQAYLSAKAQDVKVRNLILQQQEFFWVKTQMQHAVRMAGFTPCRSYSHFDSEKRPTFAYQNGDRAALQAVYMNPHYNVLKSRLTDDLLISTAYIPINPRKPLIIADCEHAEIVRIAQIKSSQGELTIQLAQPLARSFKNPVYLGELIDETFFLKMNHHGSISLFYGRNASNELSDRFSSFYIEPQGDRVVKLSLKSVEGDVYEFITARRNTPYYTPMNLKEQRSL